MASGDGGCDWAGGERERNASEKPMDILADGLGCRSQHEYFLVGYLRGQVTYMC